RSANCSNGRARGFPMRRWLPPRWRIREIPPSGVHGPARPEWIHPSTGRPARQGFNPDEAIGGGDGDEEEAVQEGSEEKGLLLRAEGEAREEEIARSNSGMGNGLRVVVAKRLEFSARDRDDDAGHHSVERVREPDEPHLARGHPL